MSSIYYRKFVVKLGSRSRYIGLVRCFAVLYLSNKVTTPEGNV